MDYCMNWNFQSSVKWIVLCLQHGTHHSFCVWRCPQMGGVLFRSGMLCPHQSWGVGFLHFFPVILDSVGVLLPRLAPEWPRRLRGSTWRKLSGCSCSLGLPTMFFQRQLFSSRLGSGRASLLVLEHTVQPPSGCTTCELGKDPALLSFEHGGWPPTTQAVHPQFLWLPQSLPLEWPVFLGSPVLWSMHHHAADAHQGPRNGSVSPVLIAGWGLVLCLLPLRSSHTHWIQQGARGVMGVDMLPIFTASIGFSAFRFLCPFQ